MADDALLVGVGVGFEVEGRGWKDGRWVDFAAGGADAALCIDCRDDGHVVLELEEVVLGGGGGAVEGVEEVGVVGSEGEFGNVVGEVEGWVGVSQRVRRVKLGTLLTRVVEMLLRAELGVSVSSCSDVEVALDFVSLEAAKYATAVCYLPPS